MMDTSKCDECGHVGNTVDPITDQVLFQEYKDRMLCASCRVDARLDDNDYSNP
jgi:rubredoxin